MSEKVAVAEAHEPPLKLGTVLRELAEGTSLHGLPKVVTSRQLAVKILWLLLLLGKSHLFRSITKRLKLILSIHQNLPREFLFFAII